MGIGVVGISYREAALEGREAVIRFLQTFEENPALATHFFGHDGAFVLLLTCHRAEIYYSSRNKDLSSLHDHITTLGVKTYHYQGEACFSHLFSVTSGTDSLIFGETEIQGQVKRAYHKAKEDRELPFSLHFLFQKALKEGKDFRSQVSSSSSPVTFPSVIANILQDYGKVSTDCLLFIGYSEINRKIAKGLRARGYNHILFCSRQTVEDSVYPVLKRNQLSFYDPYEVIFFGSSESAQDFDATSMLSLMSHPHRLLIDFNVPRTFPDLIWPEGIRYIDMDVISQRVQKQLPTNQYKGESAIPFLSLAAKKQWAVYEKKCSYIEASQV